MPLTEELSSQLNETRKHIISSSSATVVAEVITLPICTIKTNYQNTNKIPIFNIISKIYSQYGIKGFYSASGWAVTSQVVSTAAKYTWYQTIKEIIPNNFAAGAISGILASLMTHPIDVVKIHGQMHRPLGPEFNKYGIKLLYRGYSKTLTKSSIGSTCFFPFYDLFNNYTRNPTIAAISSALISTLIMQPFDYMKTRHIYGQPFFSGWFPRPYFKGLSLNLIRVVPHFTITMTLIDRIRIHL